jgi:2-amino-4-hydroxy-6-hydroxymethyldihydropteridine diphosphokinase
VCVVQSEAVTAFVGIGANLGDAVASVRGAIQLLAEISHTQVVVASSLYQTAPVDSTGPDYINTVVQLQTRLCAPDLLAQLQSIENAAGRQRPYVNAPRTLDLDLLLYGEGHIFSPTLTVPHPRMWQRAFVLLPLAQIAPQRVDQQFLDSVRGQAVVVYK